MLRRELKVNKKSLLLWSAIISLLFILIFLIYPSLISDENTKMLNDMMNSMPSEILKSFNMDIARIDTVYGWIKTEGHSIIILIGGLYSSILGSTILLKEENDKTIEFLISKPIRRNSILYSKICAGLINIVLLNIIIFITIFIGLYFSDCLEIKQLTMLSITPLLSSISLFFVSMFISTFFRKTKKSIGFSIGIVMISYFLQIMGNMGESTKVFKYFSILELSSVRNILINNEFCYYHCFISIIISFLFLFLIKMIYNRKEFFL